MLKNDDAASTGGVDTRTLGEQIWDCIPQLFVDWANAAAGGDIDSGSAEEQRLRFFALVYASLEVDGTAVTTGRKAILRSAYAELGGAGTAHVWAMLDLVIVREEAAARCGPNGPRAD